MENLSLVKDKIQSRETRILEVVDYFKYPRPLVEALFEHSKEFFEGAWHGFLPSWQEAYYCANYYIIRQMSYQDILKKERAVMAFVENIKAGESVIDIGCGVGDYLIYLAHKGVKCFAVEHVGTPRNFLEWRFKRYGVDIEIVKPDSAFPVTDYTLLLSALDHFENPIEKAKFFCECNRKGIYATPCIDETYDRPTHEKTILKDVPQAFKIIEVHNASIVK